MLFRSHSSTTWPALRAAPRLGISVLGGAEPHVARQLSAKDGDRFAGVVWEATVHGAIFIGGAPLWLDCEVYSAVRAGDHDIVVLRVLDAITDPDTQPIIFHASRLRPLVD